MAVPKRKISKARKRKRRTHWKLDTPNATTCPQCGAARRSHRVCNGCGHYADRTVVEITD